jgi:hypothetical protein
VSYNFVVLLTCTLVRSHPDSNEGKGSVKPDPFGTNSKIQNGAWQHGMHVEWKARRRLSLSQDRGHEGCIREVLQEDGCSSTVCTDHNHVFIPCMISFNFLSEF